MSADDAETLVDIIVTNGIDDMIWQLNYALEEGWTVEALMAALRKAESPVAAAIASEWETDLPEHTNQPRRTTT